METLLFPPQRHHDPQKPNRTGREGALSFHDYIKCWPACRTDESVARDLNLLVWWAKGEYQESTDLRNESKGQSRL